jgi:hypothetical protein
MAPTQRSTVAGLAPSPASQSCTTLTSSSSALIVLPPSSILPISFFQSHPFVRYLRRLYVVQQQQPHSSSSSSKQLVPYEYSAHGIVSVPQLPSCACRPLLLLPPASPPRARRKLAAVRSDNLTLSLCFGWLDVASLLSARRVCRLWSSQSRRSIVGEGRCWVQRDRSTSGKKRGNLLDNAYVRSLCHSLPFLRGLDLSKPDKLSRGDGITERASFYIAALSCLTSLSVTHYGRAVTDRSVLHLTRLRRLRSLNLSACRPWLQR